MSPEGNTGTQSQIHGIKPLTLGLVLFFVFNSLVVNLILTVVLHQESSLTEARALLTGQGGADSWKPMRLALQYVEMHPRQSLYDRIFFDWKIKFQYPPTSLLFLEPFKHSLLGDPTSTKIYLNWINAGLVLACALLTSRIYTLSLKLNGLSSSASRLDQWVQAVLPLGFALTFYPLLHGFTLGQIQVWIDFLFAAMVLAWMGKQKGLSGLLCGLICCIKPQFGLLYLWGLVRKQYSFVVGGSIVIVIFLGISLAVFGWTNHIDYLRVLSYISQHGESYYPNQSINGLLNRMLFNGNNLEWDGKNFPPANPWVQAGTLASILILVLTSLLPPQPKNFLAEWIDLLIAALAATMASPVAWDHHYGILLTIFAVSLPVTLKIGQGNVLGLAALGLAYTLCSNEYLFINQFAATSLNFLQSYLFIGALVLLIYLFHLKLSVATPLA